METKIHSLFDDVINLIPNNESNLVNSFVGRLKNLLQQLVEAKATDVNQFMTHLETTYKNPVFNEVGMILRKFHDQLAAIREGIPESLDKLASQEVQDVSSKLHHIISMTENAANTTMDLSENLMDSLQSHADQSGQTLSKLQEALKQDSLNDQTRQVLSDALEQAQSYQSLNKDCQKKLTDILVAQDYQDLTGQVIHKILNLLGTLESDLSGLIRKFGVKVDANSQKAGDKASLKGPLQDGHKDKSTQNDVDNLLDQFGF